MHVTFINQSIICLVPIVPPAFDVAEFASGLDLGTEQARISNPQMNVATFDHLQLLVVAGRIQLDFRIGVSDAVVRDVVTRLLETVSPFRPSGIGFNGAARLDMDEGEDPTRDLVQHEAVADRLGINGGRTGIKSVATADGVMWTWSLEPLPEESRAWVAAVNRHHHAIPTGEVRDEVIRWLGDLEEELPQRIRILTGYPDGGA